MLILPKELLNKPIGREIKGTIITINNNIIRVRRGFNIEKFDLNKGTFFAYVKGSVNKLNNLIGREITILQYKNDNLKRSKFPTDRSFYFVRNNNLTYLVCDDKLKEKEKVKSNDYITDDDLFNY